MNSNELPTGSRGGGGNQNSKAIAGIFRKQQVIFGPVPTFRRLRSGKWVADRLGRIPLIPANRGTYGVRITGQQIIMAAPLSAEEQKSGGTSWSMTVTDCNNPSHSHSDNIDHSPVLHGTKGTKCLVTNK